MIKKLMHFVYQTFKKIVFPLTVICLTFFITRYINYYLHQAPIKPIKIQKNTLQRPSPTPNIPGFGPKPVRFEYKSMSYRNEQNLVQSITTIVTVNDYEKTAEAEKFQQVIKAEDGYYVLSSISTHVDGVITHSYISKFSLDWKSRTVLVGNSPESMGYVDSIMLDANSRYLYFISNYGGPGHTTKRLDLKTNLIDKAYGGALEGILPPSLSNPKYASYAGFLLIIKRTYYPPYEKKYPNYWVWLVNPNTAEEVLHLTTLPQDFETYYEKLIQEYEIY